LLACDPTVGIVGGKTPRRRPLPLDEDRYDEALAAAASPEQRLMLALTVAHAARRPALRHLTLDDLDLANRRITIGGHTRPLDELTRRLLLAWLDERHARFPHTANRHLFVSKQTTHETGPVSDWWCYLRFRGLSVTLEQMRIDRQLDEALAGRGDPLHLAAVFGVSELTAMHYATAARALLAGNLEQPVERAGAPAVSRRNDTLSPFLPAGENPPGRQAGGVSMTLSNEKLTELERRLWQAASAGAEVDLPPAEHNLDPAGGASWNADRMVRAELLVKLLTGAFAPPETPRARAVKLCGARITGTLDLEAATLICPLRLDDCFFEEPVKLREAQAPMVRLSGCHVPSLDADQLETRNNLVLNEGFTARGGVTLAGARIGGQLVLDGAYLSNPDGPALDADGLRTEEGVFCRGLTARGEVRLPGAHIGRTVEFDGATLANPGGTALHADGLRTGGDVFCRGLTVGGEVRLMGASIGGMLDFTRASLARPNKEGTEYAKVTEDREDTENIWALSADQLTVEGNMKCADGFRAQGQVNLTGAHIGGKLVLNGAYLHSEEWWALNAEGLYVKGDMLCGAGADHEKFQAQGGVSIAGARIGGTLRFSHADITRGQWEALLADGLTVERDMQCGAEFTARGEVALVGARIGGGLSFTDATLDNPGGQALSADGITVEREAQCGERFTARGEVRLPRAQIGKQLSFTKARLSEGFIVPDRYGDSRYERTLQLQDLRVPVLFLKFGQPPAGTVDLVGAHVGVLVDEQNSWAAATRLLGFTYDALEGKNESNKKIGVKARLGWLTRDQDGYSLQPYEQLAAVYRRTGHEDEARRVAIEKQRRRRSTLNPLGRAWNWLLYLTVGYGYRTWQAAVWLLGLLLVGTWVFDRAYPASMVPAKQPVPPFHSLVYTLDVLLPIVDLGQQSAWQPRGIALRWSWVLIGAGWVLTTAVVAGLTAILKRD
jgi:hypothetical protein